jgi:hydroxymethylglutaryl-CoA reductase (NADPH)
MNLRNLPESLSPHERAAVRRMTIQDTLGVNLSCLGTEPNRIGDAEEKNCEQMFGSVPIPVGYAGPLAVKFSSGETSKLHLPLATTEGALVASVNRGCRAISGSVVTSAIYHGISRTIAFKIDEKPEQLINSITEKEDVWKAVGEATSSHLKIINTHIDTSDSHLFLTINADTDEAMGMNMITIAAQAIGNWIDDNCGCELVTIAGNIDSDKKPSKRTHDMGRGYDVTAEINLSTKVIQDTLKTTPSDMMNVANAKLKDGSKIAGAIGHNLHAANIVAALYLATGQDAAHVVEGSLADTTVELTKDGLFISVRSPALLVGVRGGGTGMPAQNQCLELLMQPKTSLRKTQQLAESIGAAILAGEVSLLAAQAAHSLASSHKNLAR